MTRQANLVATVAMLFVYVLGIIHVGFFAASFAYLLCQMTLMGQRSPLVMVAFSAGFLAVLYGVVELFLNVSMPAGLLF